MKICMLAPEFLPIWGGTGTYIVELVRHLPRSIEVHVLAPSREKLGHAKAKTSDYDLSEYFSENVQVHFISSASDTFVYNAAFQFACLRYLPKLIQQEGIDVIHSHAPAMPDLLLRRRNLGVPTVTTIHTTIAGHREAAKASGMPFADLEFSEKATYLGYPFLRLAELLFFSSGGPYITVSHWMKKQLLSSFPQLRQSEIRVIQNAVDTEFFSPSERETEENVLFTGRMIAAKGLTYLIEAIPDVVRTHPNVVFVFAGPGDAIPYQERLRRLAVPQRNFAFLGYLKDRKELLEWYRKCAVYVAPTLYENLPIRILEAMACARPVVATEVCGIPEIITPDMDGILVPPRSSDTLSRAISELLDDRERQVKIGQRARQTAVERFDWAENVKQTVLTYEKVLANREFC